MPEPQLRILLVTNMYPPHHLGGYELSCRDVVERFRARGHHVTVLTTSFRRDDVDDDGSTDDGVRRTLDFYWRDEELWQAPPRAAIAIARRDRHEFRGAHRDVQPDVISVWNMGALPLSLLDELIATGVPLVYHVCNDWPALNLRYDPLQTFVRAHPATARAALALLRLPATAPDVGSSGTFCWVSRATWDAAEAATPWRFPRSTVVHSGISHDDFPPSDPPASARPWANRLLYVGRIEGMKSVETIVEALPLLDGMRVDLVGPSDRRYLAGVLEIAARLGVRDRITVDVAPRHELRARYAAADALLFTSKDEPFGLTPIEAMSGGTPVVASAVGGAAEFLRDGDNCVTFVPGDPASLATAVQRVAADAELRLRLARGGVRTAREFSVDRLADRLEHAHLEAARDGHRRSAR